MEFEYEVTKINGVDYVADKEVVKSHIALESGMVVLRDRIQELELSEKLWQDSHQRMKADLMKMISELESELAHHQNKRRQAQMKCNELESAIHDYLASEQWNGESFVRPEDAEEKLSSVLTEDKE
jgi:hypothetical protein